MDTRIVNGEALAPVTGYQLGSDYLIMQTDRGLWRVVPLGRDAVDTWYELPDAVQGALCDRQLRGV